MKQTDRILKYLGDFGSITSFQAYTDLGITQLGARIDDLQKDGYSFKKTTKKAKNRYGDPVHFTEYRLEEE